ncbi:unnamed protein product [Amoebophrya sp. A120]|nr:unnamed protein product [Amoebophrya sp. A120]|eukprot:GSA120T00004853001.1
MNCVGKIVFGVGYFSISFGFQNELELFAENIMASSSTTQAPERAETHPPGSHVGLITDVVQQFLCKEEQIDHRPLCLIVCAIHAQEGRHCCAVTCCTQVKRGRHGETARPLYTAHSLKTGEDGKDPFLNIAAVAVQRELHGTALHERFHKYEVRDYYQPSDVAATFSTTSPDALCSLLFSAYFHASEKLQWANVFRSNNDLQDLGFFLVPMSWEPENEKSSAVFGSKLLRPPFDRDPAPARAKFFEESRGCFKSFLDVLESTQFS